MTMQSPLISVVVPVFNARAYLPRMLDSLLAQSVAEWQCIAVNDGSTDDSGVILDRYAARDPRIRCFHRTNGGPAAARNFGTAQISRSSRYVAFMDADDLYLPDALAQFIDAMAKDPHAVGAQCLAQWIDAQSQPLPRTGEGPAPGDRLRTEGGNVVAMTDDQPTDLNALLTHSLYPPGIFMLRRDTIDAVGPFDPALRLAEDWDYFIRVARRGHLAFINRMNVQYRRHDANISRDAHRLHRTNDRVRLRAYTDPANTAEQRCMIRMCYRVGNAHRLRLRWRAMRQVLGDRKFSALPKLLTLIAVHTVRYLVGRPTRYI